MFVLGSFTIQSFSKYLEFFNCFAVLWVPDFLHAPYNQGSSSGPPQNVGPSSRTLGSRWDLSPMTPTPPPPDQPSHGGALAVCNSSGRQSTAPNHLQVRDPAVLSPGSCKSRPQQPSAAVSGPSVPAVHQCRPGGGDQPLWRLCCTSYPLLCSAPELLPFSTLRGHSGRYLGPPAAFAHESLSSGRRL